MRRNDCICGEPTPILPGHGRLRSLAVRKFSTSMLSIGEKFIVPAESNVMSYNGCPQRLLVTLALLGLSFSVEIVCHLEIFWPR